ncbi:MAG TPA: ORF6N domain-containing protein [Verrucomicrobiae bacterium]|nr:ORF6N domain-containing protein [Verrucomicrobiae bacterium]
MSTALARVERIERAILMLRGQKVMLDSDLAELYGVSVGRLNEAVKRNKSRFPADFTFQLTADEFEDLRRQTGTSNLKSQIAISSSRWGGRRHPPYAFTEQGVAMLSSVLRSHRAVQVNVEIMRTFVRLRRWLVTHEDLARRLDELEKKYDTQFRGVFEAIRQLMIPPEPPRKRIGFHGD